MSVPRVLFLLSAAGTLLALLVPGFQDLLLLAGPCLVAATLIWMRALLGRHGAQTPAKGRSAKKKPANGNEGTDDETTAAGQNWIVLDGSNVMHWNGESPDIEIVRTLVRALERHGYAAGVIFDANAGYKISDQYMNDAAFSELLDMPQDRVMVVPKGTPADGFILKAARDFGARVVSNDRFRDWQDQYPETAQPGFLIRGGYRDGAPYLASEQDEAFAA